MTNIKTSFMILGKSNACHFMIDNSHDILSLILFLIEETIKMLSSTNLQWRYEG